MKTNELSGAALDWAVARAECLDCYADMTGGSRPAWATFVDFGDETHVKYTPSDHWGFGGPIIEREEIGIKRRMPCMKGEEWEASGAPGAKGAGYRHAYGPTPLIAAMRCYVASCLGDEVDVPPELT